MPAPVRRRYEELLRQNPGDSKVRQLLENFDRAADHPNAADCEALLRCVEQALKNFNLSAEAENLWLAPEAAVQKCP